MNFSAVIISLCALAALAHGRHLGDTDTDVNAVLRRMHQEINATLSLINSQSAMLPDSTCVSMEELERAMQGNLTLAKLTQFRCHMNALSELTPELTGLKKIIQYSQDVEEKLNHDGKPNCTLPTFDEENCVFIYIKNLLELLAQLLTKAQF